MIKEKEYIQNKITKKIYEVIEIKGKNYILVNCSEALHCLLKSKKTPRTEIFTKGEIDSNFVLVKD
ncbi:MAG: hypothetical protein JXM74_04650 [Fusobacteriaceae bacterium]|nr:hypothetical protein [Fusobacteriaceae bacterium]MBN2838025.1 hypothetical protein [Fusobacteriaceae bacterium]